MQMRQEQQKQQYMMPQYGGYVGSPVHGQFAQNPAQPFHYHFNPTMMGHGAGPVPGELKIYGS